MILAVGAFAASAIAQGTLPACGVSYSLFSSLLLFSLLCCETPGELQLCVVDDRLDLLDKMGNGIWGYDTRDELGPIPPSLEPNCWLSARSVGQYCDVAA